jgi:hypothetical protein
LSGRDKLSFSEWKQYTEHGLPRDVVDGWRTVKQLAKEAQQPQNKTYLINHLLSKVEGELYNSDDSVQLDLIGLGAIAIRGEYVEVSSPLVRAILLKSIAKDTPYIPLMPVYKGLLHVPTLIRAIKYFDGDAMRNAIKFNHKRNETANADSSLEDLVPQEEVYKTQLFLLLHSSLPNGFSPIVELAAPSARRADIAVESLAGDRVVVELVAHARDGPATRQGTVEEHIKRCEEKYYNIDNVKEVWLINFTTRQPDKGYVWPTSNRVSVIYVWHNLEWTSAVITVSPDGPSESLSLV